MCIFILSPNTLKNATCSSLLKLAVKHFYFGKNTDIARDIVGPIIAALFSLYSVNSVFSINALTFICAYKNIVIEQKCYSPPS